MHEEAEQETVDTEAVAAGPAPFDPSPTYDEMIESLRQENGHLRIQLIALDITNQKLKRRLEELNG